ncbi:MAG: FKBP-type peptidyl-prolyl cis-trans isomerase [Gemmatimonadetes bacterium]|nr:FKBP-type peptidyl-prolyl cis-trans isomerase [Gemmatimonadota bacterium]
MRIRIGVATAAATLTLMACNQANAPAHLDTDNQKASYGIGFRMGQDLKPAADSLDMPAFRKGIEDALANHDPAVSEQEIQTALNKFSQAIMVAQQQKQAAAAQKNKAEGEAYLKENGAKAGVTTTKSGLQYEVLKPGTGPKPTEKDSVRVNYKGTLLDGTVFDSSDKHGGPATFAVGGMIPGFTEALELMPVGSKYRFVIPSDLAYGTRGAGQDIGPNATLIFEIELLGIVPTK